jgi:ATP-binding cassette, subfamily B, bacterial PglK
MTTHQLLSRLFAHVSALRRKQFILLFFLMIFASFMEVFSIGMVLPFLGALTAPELIFENPLAQPFIQYLNLTHPSQILLPMTIVFCLAVITSGLIRIALLWSNVRLSFATGLDMSIDVYKRTLYQPYSVHINRNSSDVINAVTRKTEGVIFYAIMPILTIASGTIMLFSILLLLLAVDVSVAFITISGFGLIYAIIIKMTRNRMLRNSEIQAQNSTQVIKALQEGLGGIKDILIDNTQELYCDIYRSADIPLRRSQGSTQIIAQIPRFGIEVLGVIFIAVLAYILTLKTSGFNEAIPILGVLALGTQRLLPVLQQGYVAWTSFQAGRISLQDALELLDQKLPDLSSRTTNPTEKIIFNNKIELNQISFRYSHEAPWVVKDLSLNVYKGDRIGFIGTTGTGKSTLINIIMGLFSPENGTFKVDNKLITAANNHIWQKHIAHVPQSIYLSDSTIAENIAFGLPYDEIDFKRVHQSALQAQIATTIEALPMQYQTNIGERGVRLSGGQRQRIGIARALYKKADVIIFDEATSSLDDKTEQEIMHSINNLSMDITIFIIAHRLSTLKKCTKIVKMKDGNIQWSGSYLDLIKVKKED